MKKVMTGNEAIARGAFEAGVKVAAAYPGTPSTEIMETIGKSTKRSMRSGHPTRRWRWKWPLVPPWPVQGPWPR